MSVLRTIKDLIFLTKEERLSLSSIKRKAYLAKREQIAKAEGEKDAGI